MVPKEELILFRLEKTQWNIVDSTAGEVTLASSLVKYSNAAPKEELSLCCMPMLQLISLIGRHCCDHGRINHLVLVLLLFGPSGIASVANTE